MARLANLRKGDWDQFDRLLNSTDLTAEEVLKLNKNPNVFTSMLATMRSHKIFRLIHGIYNPVEDVKAAADAKVRSAGFDPKRFEWIGDPEPPSFDNENKEIVVGLYDTLGSLEQTIEFLWQWIIEGHTTYWCWSGFKTDPQHLRDFRDTEFKGWRSCTRRWVKIDISANHGKSPEWTRKNIKHTQIAGLEVMAAIAQHPRVIADRRSSNKPWFNLAALDFNYGRRERPWQVVPYLFGRDNGGVGLDAHWVSDEGNNWSCPVLLLE
jgi:hypothetical protein